MERKTWRRSIDGYDDVGLRDGVSVGDAICDLAAYEDTGLEPEEIADAVNNAADVAPVVHGRWISWEKAGNFVPSPDRHECSVCHDAAQVLVNGFELLPDYCPNCGAKMDVGA